MRHPVHSPSDYLQLIHRGASAEWPQRVGAPGTSGCTRCSSTAASSTTAGPTRRRALRALSHRPHTIICIPSMMLHIKNIYKSLYPGQREKRRVRAAPRRPGPTASSRAWTSTSSRAASTAPSSRRGCRAIARASQRPACEMLRAVGSRGAPSTVWREDGALRAARGALWVSRVRPRVLQTIFASMPGPVFECDCCVQVAKILEGTCISLFVSFTNEIGLHGPLSPSFSTTGPDQDLCARPAWGPHLSRLLRLLRLLGPCHRRSFWLQQLGVSLVRERAKVGSIDSALGVG
jgi:hypothetical protein